MVSSEQNAFNKIVENPFSETSSEDLKLVVLAIWHSGFVPSVVDITDDLAARKAIYLIDRLMRFNCVSDLQQDKLIAQIDALAEAFEVVQREGQRPNRKVCLHAWRWGLEEDLKLKIRALLPFQKRHCLSVLKSFDS